jgi:hypothetical protein
MKATSMQISDELRRQYEDEGYFILPRVIPEDHLALLRDGSASAPSRMCIGR